MPIIKRNWKQNRDIYTNPSYFDILKMYKYFPNKKHPENNTIGYCLTKVLMNNGEIWFRITKYKCARGKPGGLLEREWKRLEYDSDKPEVIRGKWYAQGFILPKGYWVGPPELHPNILKRSQIEKLREFERLGMKRQQEQEEAQWTPDWLKKFEE